MPCVLILTTQQMMPELIDKRVIMIERDHGCRPFHYSLLMHSNMCVYVCAGGHRCERSIRGNACRVQFCGFVLQVWRHAPFLAEPSLSTLLCHLPEHVSDMFCSATHLCLGCEGTAGLGSHCW